MPLRRTACAGFALALFVPAGVSAGDRATPVNGFEKAQVCACDCLYQYKVDVGAVDRESLSCRALDADGNWTEVHQLQYSPDPKLIFYTDAEYTDFLCETVATARTQPSVSE